MFFTGSNKIIVSNSPTSGAARTVSGAYINMKNWGHITIVATIGSSLSGGTLTVEKAVPSAGSGTGLAGTAIGFSVATLTSGATGVAGTVSAATSAGIAWASTGAGNAIIAELDSSDLGSTTPYVRAIATSLSAATIGITYILSRGRYSANYGDTA